MTPRVGVQSTNVPPGTPPKNRTPTLKTYKPLQTPMDNVTARYLTNFKHRVETIARELAREQQNEPILELKYRGIPYSSKLVR